MKKIFTTLLATLVWASCQAADDAPSFYGDWESGTVTGQGNTNWRWIEAVAPDRITLIEDSERSGKVARVEVRKGDNPLTFCCFDTDRAEVARMQNDDGTELPENLGSGNQQYRFSVKFDDTWQVIENPGASAFGVFLQLHGPNIFGASPALAFNATDQVRFDMLTGNIDSSTRKVYELANGSLNIGSWIDFVLNVGFAADDTGFVSILRRDEGESEFRKMLSITDIPTLQFSSSFAGGAVMDHYWKHGLYRSRQDFTSILYLDGLTRQASMVPESSAATMLAAGCSLIALVIGRRRRARVSA